MLDDAPLAAAAAVSSYVFICVAFAFFRTPTDPHPLCPFSERGGRRGWVDAGRLVPTIHPGTNRCGWASKRPRYSHRVAPRNLVFRRSLRETRVLTSDTTALLASQVESVAAQPVGGRLGQSAERTVFADLGRVDPPRFSQLGSQEIHVSARARIILSARWPSTANGAAARDSKDSRPDRAGAWRRRAELGVGP